ncbi:hypothetical protein MAL1_00203 [Bacteriophage DSS3_MAL1]|nr:hypothetical protein MAL1_00203 [Bacteriophage DSS3_MAL1]
MDKLDRILTAPMSETPFWYVVVAMFLVGIVTR